MTLTLVPIDHGELCHGWAWTVDDEDVLAERVARIVLGQYRHVAKILSGVGVPGPAANAEQAKADGVDAPRRHRCAIVEVL